MNTKEKILIAKGYEPSLFDTNLFIGAINEFYESHDCNAKLLMRDVYLGDFNGEVRRRGFISDMSNSHTHKVSDIVRDSSEIWYSNRDKPKEFVVSKLVEKYGEDAVCAVRLHDGTTCRKIFDIAVDKQYIGNALQVLKIHGFVVKKRKRNGVDIWNVSLL